MKKSRKIGTTNIKKIITITTKLVLTSVFLTTSFTYTHNSINTNAEAVDSASLISQLYLDNYVDITTIEETEGALDKVTNDGRIVGWAAKKTFKANSDTANLHFYIDGLAGQGGSFIGATGTDLWRNDVNRSLSDADKNLSYADKNGYHGFEFEIPDQYCDNLEHNIYAYGVHDDPQFNKLINNENPISFKLSPENCKQPIDVSTQLEAGRVIGTATNNTTKEPAQNTEIHFYMDNKHSIYDAYRELDRNYKFLGKANVIDGSYSFELPEYLCTGKKQILYAYAVNPATNNIPYNLSIDGVSPETTPSPILGRTKFGFIAEKDSENCTNANPIVGHVLTSPTSISGLALDKNQPKKSLEIQFYLNNMADKGGTLIGKTNTDEFGSKYTKSHYQTEGKEGFSFKIPMEYCDGQEKIVYIYAVNPATPDKKDFLIGSRQKIKPEQHECWKWQDEDNDGIRNRTECNYKSYIEEPCPDTDGDGLLDYQDTDSDNDGIPDSIEGGKGLFISDDDGLLNYLDTDSDDDGKSDTQEKGSTCPSLTNCVPVDTDGDGTADYMDPMDNDPTITRKVTIQGTVKFY